MTVFLNEMLVPIPNLFSKFWSFYHLTSYNFNTKTVFEVKRVSIKFRSGICNEHQNFITKRCFFPVVWYLIFVFLAAKKAVFRFKKNLVKISRPDLELAYKIGTEIPFLSNDIECIRLHLTKGLIQLYILGSKKLGVQTWRPGSVFSRKVGPQNST